MTRAFVEKKLVNPKPKRMSHCYQLDQYVFWRLIWIALFTYVQNAAPDLDCTVYLCPTKRMLGFYGLKTADESGSCSSFNMHVAVDA